MRRMARNSAILAKAQSGSAMVLKGLSFDAPKTKTLVAILRATRTERGALLAVSGPDRHLALSGRNLQNFGLKTVWELNAYDVLRARFLIFTAEAFAAFAADPDQAGHPRAAAS
jgi:large subunit ribosomal protein L4